MLTKVFRRRAIKAIIVFYPLMAFIPSCTNHRDHKPGTVTVLQNKNANDSSAPINQTKNISISDTDSLEKDTLAIGDIHILIDKAGDFFHRFRKNPTKFYYSDIERRDFFLLHDQGSKEFYLFGGENGGCLSCLGYVEFINNDAFKIANLPDEIQDTVKFKPYNVAQLKCRILEYPFLNLKISLPLIEKELKQSGFKLLVDRGNNKMYRKTAKYSIVSVFIRDHIVERISFQLNIDV